MVFWFCVYRNRRRNRCTAAPKINYKLRPASEPLKAFIFYEEPLEPLKCLFGPLSAFIFTFEPLFFSFCQKNACYLGFGVHFYLEKVF